MHQKWLLLLGSIVVLWSCQPDYRTLSPFGERGVRVVVEMPVSTQQVLAFDPESGKILPVPANAQQQPIDILPFPANFGFIPGTGQQVADKTRYVPVRAMVLGPGLAIGTLVETRLIGVLKIKEGGKEKQMLLATPVPGSEAEPPLENFQDFLLHYDATKRLLEDWFVFYRNLPDTQIMGWEDEKVALSIVQQAVPCE